MTLADTKIEHKKTKRRWASLFFRILEAMAEGQTISADNIKNTHLKSLSDDALEERGYSEADIAEIRRAPSNGQIF